MVATPAPAHHSFAMFDRDKTVSLSGTVKEFKWSNPHVWIRIVAEDASGRPRQWEFEMPSIQQSASAGWRSDSVKPSQRVTIEYHPLRDGSRGGQLRNATLPGGKRLGPPPTDGSPSGTPGGVEN